MCKNKLFVNIIETCQPRIHKYSFESSFLQARAERFIMVFKTFLHYTLWHSAYSCFHLMHKRHQHASTLLKPFNFSTS
jgi:hypothetical protein